MSKKTVTIPLSKLQVTFFVRRELNEDHVVHLAELYKSGTDLPPLLVAPAADGNSYDIVDGRHRKAALELLSRVETQCKIVDIADRIELMGFGFKENVGGSLPPSRTDITNIMRQFIESGASQRRIIAMFSDVYKPSLCRRYLKDAFSEIYKAKIRKAVNAVVNEAMTVPEAAKQFGLDVERLKDEIQGKKKKRRGVRLAEIKGGLSQRYKGNTCKTAILIRHLIEQYEDNELTEEQVREIFNHVEHLLRKGLRSCREWKRRFEALTGSNKLEQVKAPKKKNNGVAKTTLKKMGLV